MQDYKAFTSYYPVNSKVHRINPVIKILCLLFLIISIIITSEVKLVVFMLFITFVLIYYSKVPIRYYLDIIYGMRFIYLLLLLYLGMKGFYLEEALLLYFKITIVMLYLSLLLYTTSPKELKYAFEKLLFPLTLLKLNISPFINVIINSITFFPILFITEREVLDASSSRGLDYIHADVLSKFYVVLMNLRNTIRLTLQKLKKSKTNEFLRGYSTNTFRTNLRINKVRILDVFVLVCYVLLIAYVIWEKVSV